MPVGVEGIDTPFHLCVHGDFVLTTRKLFAVANDLAVPPQDALALFPESSMSRAINAWLDASTFAKSRAIIVEVPNAFVYCPSCPIFSEPGARTRAACPPVSKGLADE